jgi:hypothetical protein
MFFPVCAALAVFGGISSVSAITASDLPECGVECYFQEIENAGVALTDYEGQCRSAKFQLGMRACVSQKCSYDEFVFVSQWFYCLLTNRFLTRHGIIARRTLILTSNKS